MPTANAPLGANYTAITAEAKFSAVNTSAREQEWLWADVQPSEDDIGAPIKTGHGMNETHGTGTLYGRGDGVVAVFT